VSVLFHTHEFFALLALTLVAYRFAPSLRFLALLASSVAFYSYSGLDMALLFFAAILFNFACYQRIGPGRGAGWLSAAMLVDLANLFTFKYTGFFLAILADLGAAPAGAEQWSVANLVLPVGISFYTFQLMALLIDAYRGSQPRARTLGEFALFITFFGQLIAGPILRGHELLPQIARLRSATASEVAGGVGYFVIGLAKKVLLADTLLAPRVERLFATPLAWDAPTSWLLGILFGFQIYFDFSGYCDMAVGLGKFFGLDLRINFATPFVSKTPSEFWSRWNITLSRWFGDYVYVPLGGSRVHLRRTVTNLMITMLVSGLWHGAGFCFVIWGGLHGLYLCGFHLLRAVVPSLQRVASGSLSSPLVFGMWLLTYVVGTIGWVYFRSGSVAVANGVVASMFGFGTGTERGPLAEYGLLSAVLLLAHFAEAAVWQRYAGWVDAALDFWRRIPGPVQAALATPILFLLLALTKDVQGAFIYFQF
jgi:alginate O-acetyltransferase complex protein AlgI